MIELRRTLKSPPLVKLLRQQNCRAYQTSCGKVLRPLTIWARQNLQLLTSSKSGWRALVQILVDSVDSRTCRPQVIWRLRPLCFYGRAFLPYCTGLLYWHDLSKFLRMPDSLRRRNFHHILWKIKNSISASKCPITAPKIRTWSLLLSKFIYHTHRLLNRGCPRLWARLPGSGYNPHAGVGRWGRKWNAGRLPCYRIYRGGSERRGRGWGGERESKYALALNAAMCM